jgi:CubicO group peptidase (beta-lactamase class C family)
MVRRYIHALASLALVLFAALPLQQPAFAGVTLNPSQQKRIDQLFAEYDKPTSPGCGLGIMSDGRFIYTRGYGMATLDPAVPIDSTKLFDVASNAKQFTAGAIVRLVQMGKLKFTDDVRKYIPELPDYGTPVTLNHLLSHTSGLRDHILLLTLGGILESEVVTEQQTLDFITRQRKLNYTPGARYAYSNTGYFLLSIVIERVTGKPFNTFMREQFFNPLGMPRSIFRDRHDMTIPNAALGYVPVDGGQYEVAVTNWDSVAGGGGLYTSIEEIQKWDENFFHPVVGGPGFVTEMHRTGTLSNGQRLIYARGLQVDRYRGLRRVRHGGDWTGFHSQILRFPDQHTSVALFCNADGIDQYALSTNVADIVFENDFTEPAPTEPPPAPSLPIDRFVGEYFSGTTTQEVYKVQIEGGALHLQYLFLNLPLTSIGPTTFTVDGLPRSRVEFLVKGADKAHAVRVKFVGDEPDQAPIPADRFSPAAPGNPNEFAGTFYSPELDVRWTLEVPAADPRLSLVADPDEIVLPLPGPLNPAMNDAFYGAAGFLRFTRNAAGQVDGFQLSFNGPIDFRFDKVKGP